MSGYHFKSVSSVPGSPPNCGSSAHRPAQSTSADMLRGVAELGRIIERHVGPCPMNKLLSIALDLSASGYAITRDVK